MTCPVCGEKTTVIDTESADVESVYRLRKCKKCEYKFCTIETECVDDLNKLTYIKLRNQRINNKRLKNKIIKKEEEIIWTISLY